MKIDKTTFAIALGTLLWFSCSETINQNPSIKEIFQFSISNNLNQALVKITNLESGQSNSLTLNCSSSSNGVYHSQKNAVGYITCGNTFNLLDIESATLLVSFSTPPNFSNFVINEANDILTGISTEVSTNNQQVVRLISINLNTGEIVKNTELVDFENLFSESSYYNPSNNSYNVMSNSRLNSISVDNGELIFSAPLNLSGNISAFNSSNNTYYILGYDQGREKSFISSVNASNGTIISQVDIATNSFGFSLGVALYSAQDNLFHVVNSQGQLISINVGSGEIANSKGLEENYSTLLLFEK